jgi:hypothetical protein
MLRLNRDSVLKSFLEKVKEAKRLNMKDVKMTMKEIDDLFQVVYELMTEQITNALVKIEEMKEIKETKKDNLLPKKRRVIEEFKTEKDPEEKVIEPVKIIIPDGSKQNGDPKTATFNARVTMKEEPKPQVVDVKIIEEEPEEEEEEDNSLYGGTW